MTLPELPFDHPSVQNVLKVTSSAVDLSVTKDDPEEFAYLLGSAMGSMSHLAFGMLGYQDEQGKDDVVKKFRAGWDQGIEAGKGVQEVFSTDEENAASGA